MKNIQPINVSILTIIFSLFFALNAHGRVIDSSSELSDTTSSATQSIVEVIENTPNLSTLLKALNEAGLTAALEGEGPFTIFAPSNEAFAALPPKVLQDLMKSENKTRLAMLLKNHVVKGNLTTSKLNTSNLPSLGGKPLHINVRGSQITIDDANIVQSDLTGSNGVVQIIDKVFLKQ